MRRLALVVALCGTFQVLSPAAAQAWFEKIDQLSGPGPFTGNYLQYRLWCFDRGTPERRKADISSIQPNEFVPLVKFNNLEQVVITALGSGCLTNWNATPNKGSVNFRVGKLTSQGNNLPYGRDVDQTIKAWQLEFTGSFFVDPGTRFVEVSSGIGWLMFRGKAFETFSRPYVPVLATISPFAAVPRPNRIARAISAYVGVTLMDGFKAADFEAIGDFHTDKEALLTWGIKVDLSR